MMQSKMQLLKLDQRLVCDYSPSLYLYTFQMIGWVEKTHRCQIVNCGVIGNPRKGVVSTQFDSFQLVWFVVKVHVGS